MWRITNQSFKVKKNAFAEAWFKFCLIKTKDLRHMQVIKVANKVFYIALMNFQILKNN